jgi:phenylacetate-CoA ligase
VCARATAVPRPDLERERNLLDEAAMNLLALATRHVTYPAWVMKNRSARLRYLREMERRQFWSAEQLAEHQWALLRKMVAHATETSPFYKDSFRRAGVSLDDLRRPEDIRWIPTVSKEQIQQHRDEMISSRYRREDLIEDKTGGSTGNPLSFYYDHDRFDSREAAALRHDRWTGWDIGERRAILWGSGRDVARARAMKARLRSRFVSRTLMLDASAIDDAAMAQFARSLLRYRPTLLVAYANAIAMFARFVRDEGIRGIRPKGIISSAEVLTPENRELIETTFGCRVFDRYGCREVSVIASECGEHQGLHINADNLLVETVTDQGPVRGEDGEVLITDLRNFAMPLIRYRIKDVGRLLPQACGCGRGLPLMRISGGRTSDFLTATNGRKCSALVLAAHAITRIPGIEQVQFVQHEQGVISLNLVKGPVWSEKATATLLTNLREWLGDDMRFEVSYLPRIPQEQSGKYRFCVSTL